MKGDRKQFANIGLILAGLAGLASLGIFIVERDFGLPLQISLSLIVVGFAWFVFLDPKRASNFITGRQARYGSNVLVLFVAFLGILVVLNYLANANNKQWDLTTDKEFTIRDETRDVLANLPEKVDIQAFFSANLPTDQAEGLLDQFKLNSSGKLDYSFIDPIENPTIATQAKITQDGSAVLKMGTRQQIVSTITEQELASGLIRLINPETRVVYFLTGHGEFSTEAQSDSSFSVMKRLLESKNYKVDTLNLLATNQIPPDARVIVIAGARKSLSQAEVDLLDAYLGEGKALIVMAEPLPVTEFGDNPDPLADYLVANWGVNLGRDIIIDQTSNQPMYAIGSQWNVHQITTNLRDYVVVMPTTRSVTVSEAPTGLSPQIIVSTAQQAWAETDLAALQLQEVEVKPDQGIDLFGPISIGVVIESFETDARMVVFGDADFASDRFSTQYGNTDMFINSIDWASGNEEIISLTPKETTQRVLVPPDTKYLNFLSLSLVYVLPGAILASGVWTWWSRRKRG